MKLIPFFRKEIKGFLSSGIGLGREDDRLLFGKEQGNLPFLKRKEAASLLKRKEAASLRLSEQEGLHPLCRKEIKCFLSSGTEGDGLLSKKETLLSFIL